MVEEQKLTFIQPVSETDISKGKSSLATPTTQEEAKQLESLRQLKISPSSRRSRRKPSISSASTSPTPTTQPVSQAEPTPQQKFVEQITPKEQPTSQAPTTEERIKIAELSQTPTAPKREKELEETIDIEPDVKVPFIGEQPVGSIQPVTKEEKKGEFIERLETAEAKILGFDTKPDVESLKLAPLLVGRTAFRFGKGVVQSFNPYKIGEGIITTGAGVIGGTITAKDIYEGTTQTFIESPAEFTGTITGPALAPKIIKGAISAKVRRGEFIPPENLFQEAQIIPLEVGAKPPLPKVKSVAESLKLFEEAKFELQTSAPQAIKGDVAGVGKKAAGGLEDPGIFVTPAGTGSSAFLRLQGGQFSGLSLNPLAGFKDLLKVPTITKFKARTVERLPESVTKIPGFEAVKAFQETQAGKAKAFITKRSQLGQGELPRQKFEIKADTIDPWKGTPLEKGKIVTEAGTTELEAVIPVGQKFKVTGPDKFTKLGGETIRVRETELIFEPSGQKITTSTPQKFVTGEKISSEISSLSEVGKKPLTPGISSITTSSLNDLRIEMPSSEIAKQVSEISGSTTSDISKSFVPPKSSVPELSGSSSPVSLRDYSITPSTTRRSRTTTPISSVPIIPDESIPISEPSDISTPITPRRITGLTSIPDTPTKKTPVGSTQFDFPRFKEKERKKEFTVEVRRRGKFTPIFKTQDLDIALRTGVSEARGRAVASTRILQDGRIVTPTKKFKGFRLSTKEKGVLIEERKFRIDQPGEIAEITLLGIRSEKKKKKKKKKSLFNL